MNPLADPRPDVTSAPATRRRRGRWVAVPLVALLLVVVAAGWLAFRGYQAATALVDAEQTVGELRAGLGDGTTDDVGARVEALAADAAIARRATSDPIWRAASHLPAVGPDFAAVATISAALDDVARGAVPVAGDVARLTDLDGLRDAGGRIDLAPLASVAPKLAAAAATASNASRDVGDIDPAELIGQLRGPVEQVQTGLAEVSTALASAARFAALVPPMLGADGPRTYLLLSLNNAELRSAGGIVGAVAVIRADDGALELVEQRTTVDFPQLTEPVLPLTDEELQVHSDQLGRFLQNTVLTPDFPRTAELVTQFWRNSGGGEVDGVIATDPVTVSYLLAATGPVVEPGGRSLDATNVLSELLHDSYLRLRDPLDADTFYTGVAASIFGAIGAGQGDARKLVTELATAVGEHRVRVWSAHRGEQERLVATSAGGAFLSGGADDAAGIFLDDGTAGKLDYFLHTQVTVEEVRCEAASTTAIVRLDLVYNPPADIGDYPRYVTGFSLTDLPKGWISTNVTTYAPVGGSLGSTRVAAGVVGGLHATERGRDVEVLTSRLAPGESIAYHLEIHAPGAAGELPIWLTPTLTNPGALAATCPNN